MYYNIKYVIIIKIYINKCITNYNTYLAEVLRSTSLNDQISCVFILTVYNFDRRIMISILKLNVS